MGTPTYGYGVTDPGYGLDPYGDPVQSGAITARFGNLILDVRAVIGSQVGNVSFVAIGDEAPDLSAVFGYGTDGDVAEVGGSVGGGGEEYGVVVESLG